MARARGVARSPALVPSGVCTPRGTGLERAAGPARPAEGDFGKRQAIDDLAQTLNMRAHAPLRLSGASFGLLQDMGTAETISVVAQLLIFNRQGSRADLWIRNVAKSRGMI